MRTLLKGYESAFGQVCLLLRSNQGRISTPLLVAPRTAILAVGGIRPMQYGEDQELWLRLASNGLLKCTDFNPFIIHDRDPERLKFRTKVIRSEFEYYFGLSAAGFGMCWIPTITFPVRFLAYLFACSSRDSSNVIAKKFGRLDLRIDFLRRLDSMFHCYISPEELMNTLAQNSSESTLERR